MQTRTVYIAKRGDWLFITVYTDDISTGIGEASYGQRTGRGNMLSI